jgi:predicted lipoprotein with Yx(FWY)xxD motif
VIRRSAVILVVLATVGPAAGCGSSGDGDAALPTPDPVLLLSGPSEFGEIVTDEEGATLYLLVGDRRATPTCVGDCEGVWAPLPGDGPVEAGEGVDPRLVGSVERQDGTAQVTYNGWPLYRYRGDAGPGDLEGHGQLNVWFAIGVHGEAVGITE